MKRLYEPWNARGASLTFVDTIEPMIDVDEWERAEDESEQQRGVLSAVATRWDDVRDFLGFE